MCQTQKNENRETNKQKRWPLSSTRLFARLLVGEARVDFENKKVSTRFRDKLNKYISKEERLGEMREGSFELRLTIHVLKAEA